jgi:hypothetical protein
MIYKNYFRGLHQTTRRFAVLVVLALGVFQSGCGVSAMEMNVVVFNYWPRAISFAYVNGESAGGGFGAYGPGGTGGSIACCLSIRPGTLKVNWMLGGGENDPLTGMEMSTDVQLKEIKPGAKYLAVYLYADGTAAVDTAKSIPDDRFPAAKR